MLHPVLDSNAVSDGRLRDRLALSSQLEDVR
jgi:hypothetical protein